MKRRGTAKGKQVNCVSVRGSERVSNIEGNSSCMQRGCGAYNSNLPMDSSTNLSPLSVSSQMAGESAEAVFADPDAQYSLHTSVVSVKPGGMFSPRAAISAKLDPLPPKSHLSARVITNRKVDEAGLRKRMAPVELQFRTTLTSAILPEEQ